MKSKAVLLLLTSGLLILVIGLAACGRTSVPGDRVNTIPHDVDWGFTNCLVCHTGGDIALPAIFHPTNPANEDCLNLGCHFVEGSTPPVSTTTTPPITTTTTTPPVSTTTTTEPSITTTTTTPPVSTTTTPPESPGQLSYDYHYVYQDASLCFICHVGPDVEWPQTPDHEGRANDSCLDDGCHELPEQQ